MLLGSLMRFPSPDVSPRWICGVAVLPLVLAGCGSPTVTVIATPAPISGYAGARFGGVVQTGKQPLIGAAVQVYAAGVSGNGSSGTALLSTPIPTDSSGAFAVAAGYVCPSAASQLYVVARGGRAGSAAGQSNAAVAMMAVLGTCGQIVAASQIVMNEVTSVASVYALAQFFSAGVNLGATSTNSVGLGNAVQTALALADISTGSSPGPRFAANGTSAAAKLNTLANGLNGCNASASGSACATLFAATTANNVVPTNTFDAALNVVRNPGTNVASLYQLAAAVPVFTPALAASPTDWTLFVKYTGGGMNSPSGLGVDGNGDVWVASYFNAASEFSPLGVPVLAQGVTGSGLGASYGLAVDGSNNAWITNAPGTTAPGNSVSVFNSAGQSIAGSGGFTAGGLNYPVAIAIDTDNSAWIVDYGNSHLTHLSNSGQALSGAAGYSPSPLALPVAVAIDGGHSVWVSNQSANTVTKVAQDGSQFTNFACCDGPAGLAVDASGDIWIANFYGNSVSEISSTGLIVSNGSYTGGGLSHPQSIAIDGAGSLWIANYRGASITEMAGARATAPGTPLSPSAGWGLDAGLLETYGIAIDASGNVWVSNFGSNTLTEFIGMASPVRTPMLGPPVNP